MDYETIGYVKLTCVYVCPSSGVAISAAVSVAGGVTWTSASSGTGAVATSCLTKAGVRDDVMHPTSLTVFG